MSSDVGRVRYEVEDVMAAIHDAREQSAIDRAETELAIQTAAEQAAEPRTILGVEAVKLIDRIDWLHRHKWRARLIG